MDFISFLKKAKRNTYASEHAEKAASARLNSQDFEYSEGNWLYHDTYFGNVHFIGEEIAYKDKQPYWGMNYNGYVTDPSITEAEIDASLMVALRQDVTDTLPVRGPKFFTVNGYEYRTSVNGSMEQFQGREDLTKDGKLIYYALFHGGLII